MSDKRAAIFAPEGAAPKAAPFLSHAVRDGNLVFCSGQIGASPETGALVAGTVQDRTRQVLNNLSGVLSAAGSDMSLINKINIYLVEPSDFAAMNEVYTTFFPDMKPARTCVFVKALPLGTDVEIECVASVDPAKTKL